MKTLGVLGTGTMGAGLAQVAAQSGFSVIFWNRKQASVDKGLAAIKKGFGRLLSKEKISQADHDAALGRIRGVAALEDLKGADILLEAVPEDLETKRELYEKLHALCDEEVIFATNTSSLSVTALSAVSGRPTQVRRHALLQSGAGDEAGRDRARARDQRRDGAGGHRPRRAARQGAGARCATCRASS